jgi:hypothetical protein
MSCPHSMSGQPSGISEGLADQAGGLKCEGPAEASPLGQKSSFRLRTRVAGRRRRNSSVRRNSMMTICIARGGTCVNGLQKSICHRLVRHTASG